jgi:hypothetical protein
MNAKLHINIPLGVLEVEGDEKFVQAIYDDFKSKLAQGAADRGRDAGEAAKAEGLSEDRKRKLPIRRSVGSENAKARVSEYSPKFDPNLDLSKLEDFYAKFDPKNHREKILIFAVFMRDVLKKAPCAADDIFSCYRTLKDRTEIPEAFLQAIRDTQNKGGYVELVSPAEIKITIAGENYFNKKLGRREATK